MDELEYLMQCTRAVQPQEVKLCLWKNMDDGYRWEVYGSTSKTAGGPTQRKAYYRCACVRGGACEAKKVVQEHADNPRIVIATYKGRHSHPPISPALAHHPILQLVDLPFDAHIVAATERIRASLCGVPDRRPVGMPPLEMGSSEAHHNHNHNNHKASPALPLATPPLGTLPVAGLASFSNAMYASLARPSPPCPQFPVASGAAASHTPPGPSPPRTRQVSDTPSDEEPPHKAVAVSRAPGIDLLASASLRELRDHRASSLGAGSPQATALTGHKRKRGQDEDESGQEGFQGQEGGWCKRRSLPSLSTLGLGSFGPHGLVFSASK